MSTPTLARPPLPVSVRMLLDRSRNSLLQSLAARSPGERYVTAHMAALRAATAVLAVRGRPMGRSRPRSVWDVLPRVAPEFGEWATFFAAGASQRAAAEAGLERAVSTREADDLVRAVDMFYTQVESSLRLSTTPVLTATTDPQSVLTQSWMQAS